MVFTTGVVDAVWGDVDFEGSKGCSLLRWMAFRRVTAHVWEYPPLIHTASAGDAAGFRQSVIMLVIVRLLMASDTLVGRAPMGRIV